MESDDNKHLLEHRILSDEIISTMKSLINEHMQNALHVLLSMNQLQFSSNLSLDGNKYDKNIITLSKHTWDSIHRMGMISEHDIVQRFHQHEQLSIKTEESHRVIAGTTGTSSNSSLDD